LVAQVWHGRHLWREQRRSPAVQRSCVTKEIEDPCALAVAWDARDNHELAGKELKMIIDRPPAGGECLYRLPIWIIRKPVKSAHGIRLCSVQDSRHGILAVKHRDVVQILAAARIFDKKTARSGEPAHDLGCKPLPWPIAVGRNDEPFDPLQP